MSNKRKGSEGGGFVGHIGGHDFVFIVPLAQAEPICKTLIVNFDIIVFDPFGKRKKVEGTNVVMDRRGVKQKIPLIGMSIAFAPNINPLSSTTARCRET